ncbi:hypothetical protein KQI84_12030 [bacterium]|nr:hypothetical protein [bacterium]
MKSLAFTLAIIAAIALALLINHSAKIFYTPGLADDDKAIRGLVQRYYSHLRADEFEQAALCYEPSAFLGVPFSGAEALKAAKELSGEIPEEISVEALRINGTTAFGEIVIQRDGIGPVSIQMTDSEGNRIGTWARTLHFVKLNNGQWRIAKDDDQALELDLDSTSGVLNVARQYLNDPANKDEIQRAIQGASQQAGTAE